MTWHRDGPLVEPFEMRWWNKETSVEADMEVVHVASGDVGRVARIGRGEIVSDRDRGHINGVIGINHPDRRAAAVRLRIKQLNLGAACPAAMRLLCRRGAATANGPNALGSDRCSDGQRAYAC